jgi:hypothetical protein
MTRRVPSLVVVSLLFGGLSLTPLYGANKPAHQEDSGSSTPQISSSHGQATYTKAVREVVLSDLPPAQPYHGKPRAMPDQKEPNEGDENRVKGPAAGYVPGLPSPGPLVSLGQSPGTTVSFLGGSEEACGFWIPSDHALAASSSYELQVLNACIYVFNNAGSVLKGPTDLATFFGAANGDAVGDPRALYDWRNSRFIIVAEDFTANNILVAASKNSDPTGGWWIYTLSANAGGLNGAADFPMIGQTVSEEGNGNYGGLYISWDRFVNGVFQDDVIWVLPKDKIYAGAGFSFHLFYNLTLNGTTVDHVQPADVMNRGDQPRSEFLVNTKDFNFNCNAGSPCNGLVVWAIYYGVPPAGGSPTLTGSFVSTANNYIYPITATQPGNPSGTECAINTGPAGITSEVYWSAGDLYLTATTAALNGAAEDGFLYWQVHPYLTNASPAAMNGSSIRNEVCWGCNGFTDNTISEYYPAVQPTEEGDITIVFNWSSSSQYPSTAYLSSRTTEAAGAFPDSGLNFVSGEAAYCQIDRDGRNRWGDYTATSPYGSIRGLRPTFWFAGQYSKTDGDWGTAIGQNAFTAIEQP